MTSDRTVEPEEGVSLFALSNISEEGVTNHAKRSQMKEEGCIRKHSYQMNSKKLGGNAKDAPEQHSSLSFPRHLSESEATDSVSRDERNGSHDESDEDYLIPGPRTQQLDEECAPDDKKFHTEHVTEPFHGDCASNRRLCTAGPAGSDGSPPRGPTESGSHPPERSGSSRMHRQRVGGSMKNRWEDSFCEDDDDDVDISFREEMSLGGGRSRSSTEKSAGSWRQPFTAAQGFSASETQLPTGHPSPASRRMERKQSNRKTLLEQTNEQGVVRMTPEGNHRRLTPNAARPGRSDADLMELSTLSVRARGIHSRSSVSQSCISSPHAHYLHEGHSRGTCLKSNVLSEARSSTASMEPSIGSSESPQMWREETASVSQARRVEESSSSKNQVGHWKQEQSSSARSVLKGENQRGPGSNIATTLQKHTGNRNPPKRRGDHRNIDKVVLKNGCKQAVVVPAEQPDPEHPTVPVEHDATKEVKKFAKNNAERHTGGPPGLDVYAKQEAWARRRDKHLSDLQRNAILEREGECTFKPRINRRPSCVHISGDIISLQDSDASDRAPINVVDRLHRIAERSRYRRTKRLIEREMELQRECTFRPSITNPNSRWMERAMPRYLGPLFEEQDMSENDAMDADVPHELNSRSKMQKSHCDKIVTKREAQNILASAQEQNHHQHGEPETFHGGRKEVRRHRSATPPSDRAERMLWLGPSCGKDQGASTHRSSSCQAHRQHLHRRSRHPHSAVDRECTFRPVINDPASVIHSRKSSPSPSARNRYHGGPTRNVSLMNAAAVSEVNEGGVITKYLQSDVFDRLAHAPGCLISYTTVPYGNSASPRNVWDDAEILSKRLAPSNRIRFDPESFARRVNAFEARKQQNLARVRDEKESACRFQPFITEQSRELSRTLPPFAERCTEKGLIHASWDGNSDVRRRKSKALAEAIHSELEQCTYKPNINQNMVVSKHHLTGSAVDIENPSHEPVITTTAILSPTNLEDLCYGWVERRDERREAARREKARMEAEKCTFQPKINTTSSLRSANQSHPDGKKSVSGHFDPSLKSGQDTMFQTLDEIEGNRTWGSSARNQPTSVSHGTTSLLAKPQLYMQKITAERIRRERILLQRRQLLEDAEMKECTFQPQINDAPAYVKSIAATMTVARRAEEAFKRPSAPHTFGYG